MTITQRLWVRPHSGERFFFMEKHKANKRNGHPMVSDHCRPRPRVTPEECYRCKLIFSFLRSGTKAKAWSWVTPLNMQCLNKFEKWGTECLNTRFPLTTLLCVIQRVAVIQKFYTMILNGLWLLQQIQCNKSKNNPRNITLK